MRRKLAADPHIAALSLRVFPSTERSVIVLGGATPHEVYFFNGKPKCDCTAASFGNFCKHVAAIEYQRLQDNRKGTMPTFELDRSGAAERGNPVSLPRKGKMAYAGLLSGWFLLDGQYGTTVGIKTLVTHVAAGKGWENIDQITEAMTFVNPKWWFNSKKNEASHLMQVVRALTGLPYSQLEKLTTDEVKQVLNDNVGSGIQFAASVENKKDGTPFNAIDKDSFEQADSAFSPLAQKMNAKIEVKTNKDGFPYIAKPQPVYQAAEAASAGSDDDLEDSVPF